MFPRTSIPDDAGLETQETAGGVRLSGPVEPATGIRKTIEIRLAPDRPAVTLTHRLANAGYWPVELAPWAITQLPLGGIAILPLAAAAVNGGLAPDRLLALWPATRLHDVRLDLADDFIFVQGKPAAHACKIGTLVHQGWVGHLTRAHCWSNGLRRSRAALSGFRLQRRSVLQRPLPGARNAGAAPPSGARHRRRCHVETWEIFTGLDAPASPEGARRVIEALHL